MSQVPTLLAVVLFAALAGFIVRRMRELADEVRTLGERVRELSVRLDAAEQDAASALAQADVAESVLLDKGVADEDDLEAARARSGAGEPGHVRGRDGDLH
jgi:outer membrane murein-binding lipoprotein Lpp